jgi:hypothetical protein
MLTRRRRTIVLLQVHAVSISHEADRQVMQRIARQRGGRVYDRDCRDGKSRTLRGVAAEKHQSYPDEE